MKGFVAVAGFLFMANASAQLCNGEILQPEPWESIELSAYTNEQRGNAIAGLLHDGCLAATDLIGQKRFSANWSNEYHDEMVTNCVSSSGGQRQIIVTFNTSPYNHTRYSVEGQCEHIIQNVDEVKLLKDGNR